MIFKSLRNGILSKLEIHVWCKNVFLDKLVLMLFGAAMDFFSENHFLVKTIGWVGWYVCGVGGVGMGGGRKRVAEWSEGESEEIGGLVFRGNGLPIPPIGSLFPCLGRKKLTWRKSISAENCRTKHIKKKFST